MQTLDTHIPPILTQAPVLENIRSLVQADFAQMQTLIENSLISEVDLIPAVCQHIMKNGGKRLRPLLTLLSAKLCNYTGTQHINLAVIIEFIHTATLLHDDVVDASCLRRGLPTVNSIWGNQTSILVGDFLHSRAFQLMAELQNHAIIDVLAKTTNTIAQGEVLQLAHRHDADVTEDYYFEVVRCKTGLLFAVATELGAIIAETPVDMQNAAGAYGLHLGMAFQIIDDCLDYAASPSDTGKNIGDDLAEGKATLPLIYAMQHSSTSEKKRIQTAIQQGGLKDLETILSIIESTQAIAYAKRCAQQHVNLAIEKLQLLPNNIYQDALLNLAQFAVDRKS